MYSFEAKLKTHPSLFSASQGRLRSILAQVVHVAHLGRAEVSRWRNLI